MEQEKALLYYGFSLICTDRPVSAEDRNGRTYRGIKLKKMASWLVQQRMKEVSP